MNQELEKEYQKTFKELLNKYNIESLDDEENLFLLFDEFYKKYKTFSIFEKSANVKYLNIIKKIKEEEKKKKKSVHYMLKVDPPEKKEIDYGNLDMSGESLNNNEKEKNLQKIFENFKIKGNINSMDMNKKLNEEIEQLGKKLETSLTNEKKFKEESDKSWENYKEDKNIKFNTKEEEEKAKKIFIDIKLKDESMPNEEFQKFLDLIKAKKKNFYEKDPYITDYNNDIIYKSNKRLEYSNMDDLGATPFTLKLKEMANKENNYYNLENDKNSVMSNIPKEYGKDNLKNVTTSNVFKIFERDFDNFIKDQYNG